MNNAKSAIVRPLVTEKSMTRVAEGRYAFAVGQYATKTEIKKAIEKTFSVKVIALSTSVVKGKSRRAGARRLEIANPVWKKAIVTVKKGDRIYLFESGAPEEEVKKEKKTKKEETKETNESKDAKGTKKKETKK